jgi:hypothetical protein
MWDTILKSTNIHNFLMELSTDTAETSEPFVVHLYDHVSEITYSKFYTALENALIDWNDLTNSSSAIELGIIVNEKEFQV